MNGFFATASYNINNFVGIVTDIDWAHGNFPNDPIFPGIDETSSVMIGPQIYPIGHHRLTPFGHVEFGLTHFLNTLSASSGCGVESSITCNLTDGSFGVSAGGGVDFSLTHHFAVRIGEFDWEQSRMFEPGAVTQNKNQNNWKVKAGIILRFGGK